MNFDDAKEFLKNSYLELGFELVDEHKKELFLKFTDNGMNVKLSEEEILEFQEFEQVRPSFENTPVECGICNSNYREQIVSFSEYDRRGPFIFRDKRWIFGEPSNDEIFVEIGSASMFFYNYFRFVEDIARYSLNRMRKRYRVLGDGVHGKSKFIDMSEVLLRPITIKVHNIKATSPERAIAQTSQLIDSCLFELSYLKNLSLLLPEKWHLRQPRIRPFHFGDDVKGNELQLPRVRFNSELIKFYQRGKSTDDPVIQYLSFYHVLEYYFVSVSDEQLYNRLSQRINDPKFITSPSQLNRIIQDTLTHKRETDETEMLKLVLQKYVDKTELIEFIKAYEEYLGDQIYTKRRVIFGDSLEIKLNPDHVIANLSTRIKVIRNALVHSSDRYERKQRYIPSSSSEKVIKNEIPLIRHLAEKVVIGSAEQ